MYEIIKDEPLVQNWTSQLHINGRQANSLQVVWENVTGITDGIINIYVSNDFRASSLAYSITINSESNLDDALMLILTAPFNYMKINYVKNNITAGKLNLILK
jgi:hypothetical protein